MRAVILARVSDKEQRRALPAQLIKFGPYIEEKGLELIEATPLMTSLVAGLKSSKDNEDLSYIDPLGKYIFDETAYVPDKRKKFNIILSEIERLGRQEPIVVVADKVNRVMRDLDALQKTLALIEKGIIELHCIGDHLFLDKNMSEGEDLMLCLQAVLGRFGSKSSSYNIRRMMSYLKKQGVLLTKAPFGYINTRDLDADGRIIRKWVKPHPATRDALLHEYLWRKQGLDYRSIARRLKEEFSIIRATSSVERDLKNPFYNGFIEDEKEGGLYPHKYERIIPPDLFEAVQNLRKRPHAKHYYGYLYRGLITCGQCGSAYTSYKSTKYPDKIYVKCTRRKDPNCQNRPVLETWVTRQIAEELATCWITEDDIKKVLPFFRAIDENAIEIQKADLASMKERLAELESEMRETSKRGDMYGLPRELVKRDIDKLANEWHTISNKIKASEGIRDVQKLEPIAEKVMQAARQAHLIFVKSSNIEKKRELLQLTIEPLKISDKNVDIRFNPKFAAFFGSQKEKWWS